jgi:polyphosphate kinase 2 (PPK2 family)
LQNFKTGCTQAKKNSILVIFQGMDASGKDGAVKNVFGNINPMGIKVFGFKKPTEEEFGHDFFMAYT